jgi:hypothetical protein
MLRPGVSRKVANTPADRNPERLRGRTRTVTVKAGSPSTISWPADQYGYYYVVITANTSDDFRRRYAGRIA